VINPKTKKILRWTGSALALLGVGFVVSKLLHYSDQVDLGKLDAQDWLALLALVVVCGLANALLALAWRELLQHQRVALPMVIAVRIYGVSQLAKYVPSNVLHLIGRQALATAAGLPGWPVAKATLWELGTLLYASVLFAPLALPFLDRASPAWVGTAAFIATLALGVAASYKLFSASVARAVSWQAFYLSLGGLQFLVILLLLVPGAELAPVALGICGAYVLAWVAGFVTPGAPAGVGVRELVLYFLLSHMVSQPDLLAAVVLARMVSVCGDVLFYLGAVGVRDRLNVNVLS
jgi:uncharacterized membrane protein YbhN (UPF0104 family)